MASQHSIEMLAHRGLWSQSRPPNSKPAIDAALRRGFGIEIDVRDSEGELVVAHDPPGGGFKLRVADALQGCAQYETTPLVALDIKADGLAGPILELMGQLAIDRYFVFDMSVPDLVRYSRLGVPFFTRQSEYEQEPAFYDECAGVWLDAFNDDWYGLDTIQRHLDFGKSVAVVSPELHGRAPEYVWELVRRAQAPDGTQLYLCTDNPLEFTDDGRD